ncbi:MAG: helix-turn-helix transcriptional regulator [Ectothiorhodospiraceae bacterium]|nr:helix-turn-helix transcriptional regulator [Ectothiorhodospiraceae bacterium]MCH8503011.1 AraC family transcriptional regulator [Ectothiorhodospiraceae bacterium]
MAWAKPQSRRTLGQVYAGHDLFVYVGQVPDISVHQHPAPALCLGLRQPFEIADAETGLSGFHDNVLVPAESRSPAMLSRGEPMGFVFVGADHASYQTLRRLAGERPTPGAVPNGERLRDVLHWAYAESPDFNSLMEQMALLLPEPTEPLMDERVRRALQIMGQDLSGRMTLEDVAARVYLSPTRLVHLFKRETGLTFRRYRLWVRVMVGVNVLGHEEPMPVTLTRLALTVGFADLAHLSRTFRQNFGLRPTSVLRMDGSLTVHTPFNTPVAV